MKPISFFRYREPCDACPLCGRRPTMPMWMSAAIGGILAATWAASLKFLPLWLFFGGGAAVLCGLAVWLILTEWAQRRRDAKLLATTREMREHVEQSLAEMNRWRPRG